MVVGPLVSRLSGDTDSGETGLGEAQMRLGFACKSIPGAQAEGGDSAPRTWITHVNS